MTDRLPSHRPARSRATTGGCRVRGRRLQAPATAPDDPLRRRRDRQILHGAVLGRHPRAARPARAVRGLGVERGGSPGPAGTAPLSCRRRPRFGVAQRIRRSIRTIPGYRFIPSSFVSTMPSQSVSLGLNPSCSERHLPVGSTSQFCGMPKPESLRLITRS